MALVLLATAPLASSTPVSEASEPIRQVAQPSANGMPIVGDVPFLGGTDRLGPLLEGGGDGGSGDSGALAKAGEITCQAYYNDGTPDMGSMKTRLDGGSFAVQFNPSTSCYGLTFLDGPDDDPELDFRIVGDAWYCATSCNPPIDGTPCVSFASYLGYPPCEHLLHFSEADDKTGSSSPGPGKKEFEYGCAFAAGAPYPYGPAVGAACFGIDQFLLDDYTGYGYDFSAFRQSSCEAARCAEYGVVWLVSMHTVALESNMDGWTLAYDADKCTASGDPCKKCELDYTDGFTHLKCLAFRGFYVEAYTPPPPDPDPQPGPPGSSPICRDVAYISQSQPIRMSMRPPIC